MVDARGRAAPAGAARPDRLTVLPGASSAEGIAAGRDATFSAGDAFRGDIFRGNVRRGTARLFIDAPDGRQAAGMKADLAHRLLFVAGALTGQADVYDLRSGATVASYQLGQPPNTIINDVASPGVAPGSPTRSSPGSTSCRSAAGASRARPGPWSSAARPPPSPGPSPSTASRPPPTAGP